MAISADRRIHTVAIGWAEDEHSVDVLGATRNEFGKLGYLPNVAVGDISQDQLSKWFSDYSRPIE